MERRDVIVVSSVSCIYGLGEPEDFAKMMVSPAGGGHPGAGRAAEKAGGHPL